MRLFLATTALALTTVVHAAQAQQYQWTNTVPPTLEGRWVETGQNCEAADSRVVIFSDGGYRWRRGPTDWGFARGRFAYTPGGATVYFQLRRLVQGLAPDYQITVSGPSMRRLALASGTHVKYEKCR